MLHHTMELVSEDDVLSLSINLTKIFNEYLFSNSKKLYLFRFFNISVFMITLFFIVMNIKDIEVEFYTKTMESAITIIHVSIVHIYIII